MHKTSGIGRVGRRDFALGLSAFTGTTALRAARAADSAPVHTIELNHVALNCSDLQRSINFYQSLFGMPVQARQGSIVCLRVGDGPQFLGLGGTGRVNPASFSHYCFSVERFVISRLKSVADNFDLNARTTLRGPEDGGGGPTAPEGTTEFYFFDPDGIPVQLQHPSYGGGAGMNGEVLKLEPLPGKPRIQTRAFNHMTLSVADVSRSLVYYQKIFGLPIQTKQANTPVLGVGPGTGPLHPSIGLAQVRGGMRPGINHLCLGVDHFDVDRITKILNETGVKSVDGMMPKEPMTMTIRWRKEADNGGGPGAPKGTPELYFADPDGLIIQLQDTSYCGGSGPLGNICSF